MAKKKPKRKPINAKTKATLQKKAAKSKYNFQPHFPGPGVGGPCLPVNSYQYLNSSKKIDTDFLKIVQDARKINENMPNHIINLLIDAFSESEKSLENSTIALLGVSYKPNVKDIQLTPAEHIIKKLQDLGAIVHIYDPYFISQNIFDIHTEKNLNEIISNVDSTIIVTAHDEFKKLEISLFKQMKTPVLVDTRGIIDPEIAKQNQLIFRGLGRGHS